MTTRKKTTGKGRRRYSDEERAASLAALASNGGDLTKTSREVGVPRKTLENWSKDATARPGIAKLGEHKKADLAALFEGFIQRALGLTTDEDITAASLKDRMTAVGIAADKMRLLRGESTSISESRDDGRLDEFRRRYANAVAADDAAAAPRADDRP